MAAEDEKSVNEEGAPPTDGRVEATGNLWWAAVAMLGVCIPLIVVTRMTNLPVIVLCAAMIATVSVWAFGKANSGARRKQEREASNRERQLEKRIKELEERLASVETISGFEMRRAAEAKLEEGSAFSSRQEPARE